MRVRATDLGFYDKHRLRKGDVFELKNESDFSPSWMSKEIHEKSDLGLEEVAPKKGKKKGKTNEGNIQSDTVI